MLMALFCAILAVNTLLYILGEFVQADMAFMSEASQQTRFLLSTLMILLTICLLPLSLRMFKLKRIQADLLERKEKALTVWGTLRLATMGLLLTINTVLYYALEFESAYGYLALVVLLCMPFVLPTMNRCVAETSPEPPKEDREEEHETSNLNPQIESEETDSSNS